MADLEYVVADGIATITLNRPERKNAFTREMVLLWVDALHDARSNDDVRVLVLTGAGDSFCSGVDVDRRYESAPTPLDRKQFLSDLVHQIPLTLETIDKPAIAAVNGVAVGAGMDMALMCDLRVVARSARMSEGYIRLGMVPGDGGCYYLPRIVGTARALELLLTGDWISSAQAEELGIANQVVDDADLSTATTLLARKIADAPPVAIRMIKRAVYQSASTNLRTSLDMISSHAAVIGGMKDSVEAIAAAREGRPATFSGT